MPLGAHNDGHEMPDLTLILLGFPLDMDTIPMAKGCLQFAFQWSAMLNIDAMALPKGHLQLQRLVLLGCRLHLSLLTAGYCLLLPYIQGANAGFLCTSVKEHYQWIDGHGGYFCVRWYLASFWYSFPRRELCPFLLIANSLCSYQTTPQVQEVPLQSMSRFNVQERFQGPLRRGDAFFYGAGVHFPPQSNAGDQLGHHQGHYQPDLRAGRVMWIFKGKHVLVVSFKVMAWQAS